MASESVSASRNVNRNLRLGVELFGLLVHAILEVFISQVSKRHGCLQGVKVSWETKVSLDTLRCII